MTQQIRRRLPAERAEPARPAQDERPPSGKGSSVGHRAITRWARSLIVRPSSRKHVFMQLVAYANDEGTCFPSEARLAAETGLSVRTVQDSLNDLVAAGLVQRLGPHNINGKRVSTDYRLMVEGPPATIAGEEGAHRQLTTEPPATDDTSDRQQLPVEEREGKNLCEGDSTPDRLDPVQEGFAALWRLWPPDGLRNRPAAEALWQELSPEARLAAARWAPTHLAAKAKPRKPAQWLLSFLQDRSWESAAAEPRPPSGGTCLQPRTPAWWLEFFRRVQAGGDWRQMTSLAAIGVGITVSASGKEGAPAVPVEIAVGSPQFHAWRQHVERLRARLPVGPLHRLICAPSEWPPRADDAEGGRP